MRWPHCISPTLLRHYRITVGRVSERAVTEPSGLMRAHPCKQCLFLVAHLAGLRGYTSFLSGTVPSPATGWKLTVFFGLIYLVLYFAFVLLVPVLLLAALVQRFVQSLLNRR